MTGSTKSDKSFANSSEGRAGHSAENQSARFVRSWEYRRHEHARTLRHCRQHPSEKNIHDLRVSTRRLLAHLEVLRSLSPTPIEKTRRRLKRIMRLTAPLRDAQVQVQRLDRLTRRNRHAELAPAKRHLKKQAHKLRFVVAKKLRRREPKLDLIQPRKIVAGHLPPSASQKRLRAVSDKVLRASVRTVQSRLRRAATTEIALDGHRARVAVKKLRYLSEVIAPPTAHSGQALNQLQAIQSALGELHDFDVFLQRLEKSAVRHKRIAAWLKIKRATLQRRRRAMVAATPSLNARLFGPRYANSAVSQDISDIQQDDIDGGINISSRVNEHQ